MPKTKCMRKEDEDGQEVILWLDSSGQLHRENGPAWTKTGHSEKWFQHGKLHRNGDKPAITNFHESLREYYKNGVLHREHGPARVTEYVEEWFLNGMLHRPLRPAVIKLYPHHKEWRWFINGNCHNALGPALITEDADGTKAYWFINGKPLDFKTWQGYSECSPEQLTSLALKYA